MMFAADDKFASAGRDEMCFCDKKNAWPNACVSVTLVFVIMMMVPYVFIPAGEFGKFEEHACRVERIVYPTELPTPENTTGWAECDCGKHCQTWSPCIQIFTNVSNTVFARQQFYDIRDECTFHVEYCPDGEDITTVLGELDAARAQFVEYDNKTVTCFYDNDDLSYIFLQREWDWPMTIGFLFFVGLFALILIVMNAVAYYNAIQRRRESKNMVL